MHGLKFLQRAIVHGQEQCRMHSHWGTGRTPGTDDNISGSRRDAAPLSYGLVRSMLSQLEQIFLGSPYKKLGSPYYLSIDQKLSFSRFISDTRVYPEIIILRYH